MIRRRQGYGATGRKEGARPHRCAKRCGQGRRKEDEASFSSEVPESQGLRHLGYWTLVHADEG